MGRGGSSEDKFGLAQDGFAADGIARLLDSFALDEIDPASERPLQSLSKRFEPAEIVLEMVGEHDKKIRVAAPWIEVLAAGGRAEGFQPGDRKAPAQISNFLTF